MNHASSIGSGLRHARELAGLSLRGVASATEGRLTAGALSLIERGHRYPSLRSLEALALALRVVIKISPAGVSVEQQR
jgi:transcriptional regulator with XRE-family HTH domain